MPKPTLRRAMRARRRQLTGPECEAASAAVQSALRSHPLFAAARVVACYHAIDNELSLEGLLGPARQEGKTIALPVVSAEGMVFRVATHEGMLSPGAFNIAVPPADAPLVPVDTIDLVLVPGIAFDLRGHRLGYGKGYYDRTFHAWEGSGRLVGICYDFQLVEHIAAEPHDVVMDMILTEKRVIVTRNLP